MKAIGIVGTGRMGSDLAVLLLGHGYSVTMLGVTGEACKQGRLNAREDFDELIQNEILSPKFCEECLSRLHLTEDYAAFADVEFIFEAVVEKVEIKREVFAKLEENCKKSAIFVSITSGLTADCLADELAQKNRLIVAHAWNPPHLVPLVEVVNSRFTSEIVTQKTLALLQSLNRKVVLLKRGVPGFIGNRLMHAMYREALFLIEEGVATAEEIDATVLNSFGPRFASIGPLEYYDSCGLDLQYNVQSYLLADLCSATAPQKPLTDCCTRGDLGPKTGKGLYDWSQKDFGAFRLRKNKPFFQFVNWESQASAKNKIASELSQEDCL